MNTQKAIRMFALGMTAFGFVASTALAQRDYLLENCQNSYLSPGGEGPRGEEGRQFRLRYWNLPRTVRPGQAVKSRILWETLSGNPNAVCYATVIGNWDPERPIALLYRGMQKEPGNQFEGTFEFVAPERPGRYRIRWILTQAFKPITRFYSQRDGGADDPGNGWWCEMDFFVEPERS